MKVQEWWKLLNNHLNQLAAQYSEFAALSGGQFSIIKRAAQLGVTITAANGAFKGNEIKKALSELKTSLPSIDPDHVVASRALMELYLEHLKRYRKVHENFSWLEKAGAKAFGIDLDQVGKDILEKDIPVLEQALSTSSDSLVSIKREAKQTAPVTVATMDTSATTLLIPAPLLGRTLPIDFSTATAQEIALYAQDSIRNLEEELKPLQRKFEALKKGKMISLQFISQKERPEKSLEDSAFKKLIYDLETCNSIVRKLEVQLAHYRQIKQFAEDKSKNLPAIHDLLAKQRTPILIEEIISLVEDYEKLGEGVQNLVQEILEATFQQPVLIKRILVESEKDTSLMVNSLSSEVNALLKILGGKEQAGIPQRDFSNLRLPFKRVGELSGKIIAQVRDYPQLDARSRQSLTALLQTVLNKPDFFKLIILHQHDDQIAAALAAPIQAAIYNKWVGNNKSICLEGHVSTAVFTAKIFKQPMQPLNNALLEKQMQPFIQVQRPPMSPVARPSSAPTTPVPSMLR